jgi:Cysteine dioxygenase type I
MTTATAAAPLIDPRPAATPVVVPLRRSLPWGEVAPTVAPRPAYSPADLLAVAKAHAGSLSVALRPEAPEPTERTYRLLASDDDVEVWVIHWPAGGHIELHDHGESSGAVWVVRGSLEEHVAEFNGPRAALRRRRVDHGGGISFGSRYVHDVHNAGPQAATSVHAYSPPLQSMTYYGFGLRSLTVARTEHRAGQHWEP